MNDRHSHRKSYAMSFVHQDNPKKISSEAKTIPADILMEILKGLPSKNLMRFRCVSKTWNHVIRDRIFAKLHRTISQTRPGGTTTIFLDRNWPGRELYFYKINHHREAIHELTIDLTKYGFRVCSVTEIVNGLVCLGRHRDSIICNITTHEIISLPPQDPDCTVYPMYLLGYDPLNDEYKVLCIWFRTGICKYTVFTVGKSEEWREVNDPLHYHLAPNGSRNNEYGNILCEVVYLAGAIHWLSQYYRGEKQKLVSFDVREEKFRVIGVPAIPEQGNIGIRLACIGGHMVVFGSGSNCFVLEDYKNQVWVEGNIKFPQSQIFPIGSMENKLIFSYPDSNAVSEFDPNNGRWSGFVVTGLRQHAVRKYIGPQWSMFYPARYSICETVENIYPLR